MPDKVPLPEVLYLSYDGLTDTLGQSQILPYLCGLADAGYVVTVITFEKRDRFRAYRFALEEKCREHGIHWKPLVYHKIPLVLSTIYDLYVLRKTVRKILVTKRIEIVHCRSYLTALTGLWAKRKFRVKFLFDMRGFWVDERIDGGIWTLKNPLFRLIYTFFKKKEKQFVKEADHIVSLTENARAEIQSWNIGNAPITVIPTCVDMLHFEPNTNKDRSRRLREELSIGVDEFVLVYSGSWGSWYRTDQILEFFEILVSRIPASRLLILTPDNPDLFQYPFRARVIIKNVSRDDMPAYLGAANALVCFIKPAFSKKASSATKMAEAWAMNLPVVTNRGWGDIETMYEKDMPLLLCDSSSDYEDVVSLLVDCSPLDKRDMLFGSFDLLSGIQKYKGIYQSLTIL